MILIKQYDHSQKSVWNQFVYNSKNGTFLLDRNYMDYHSNRFEDHSLMFYKNEELIALLPANLKDQTLYSHQGLTYGGLIMSNKIRASQVLEILDHLINYLKSENIKKFVYKAIPHIYHNQPSEEDLYALFRNGAKLYRRDLSSTILTNGKPTEFQRGKMRSIKKAKQHNLQIRETADFDKMYQIIQNILTTKYQTKPVHTSQEMKLLQSRFLENIKLFGCYKGEEMISGALIYVTKNVAHAQYVYGSELGKELGANDLMYDYLINDEFKNKQYFSFGISTEQDGLYLNENLIQSKEELTARAICYDHYELNI